MAHFTMVSELRPQRVFEIFSDIAAIPRGSGNTEGLAAYCVEFAKKRSLRTYVDDYGNVMIFKNGSPGYENSEPVILQGHMDMVCEKRPGCALDMEREGVLLRTDGEYVWAEGTTLGGDDGIAVAYILALLDSRDVPHPPIEALLTRDEEIGLIGAKNLDPSRLKARRIINIDSEKEGVITAGCAGGTRAFCALPLTFEEKGGTGLRAFELKIAGLAGGHSGLDINKNRKNAAKLMGELLFELRQNTDMAVSSVSCGGRVNVIPKAAEAVVCVSEKYAEKLRRLTEDFAASAPGSISQNETEVPARRTDSRSTDRLILALTQSPDGVQSMEPEIEGMVRISLNLGSVALEGEVLKMGFMLRSSARAEMSALVGRLREFFGNMGGTVEVSGEYPPWEYRAESPLRTAAAETYFELYGSLPKIETVHAGLECGILSEKIPQADIISIGPDILDVHTPDERMDVASVGRCWSYILKLLEKLR